MHKGILFGLLVMVLLVSACSSGNTRTVSAFVGGTNALNMEFTTGAPPDQILDDKQFPFSTVLRVENKGEYDLTESDGYIELQGIEHGTFGVSETELVKDIPALDGVRKNFEGSVSQGYADSVSFDNLNYQSDLKGDLMITLRASACYNYETQASALICVKEEAIDDVDQNAVCKVGEDKPIENSGAPIQVTKITESSRGRDGIQVLFTIEHVGDAGAYFYREDETCDTRLNNPRMYEVFVEVEPIVTGSIRAQCSGFSEGTGDSGYIKLFDAQPRTVTCSFDTRSVSQDFVEPLNINLRYRYQEFISKDILIKDVTTNQ